MAIPTLLQTLVNLCFFDVSEEAEPWRSANVGSKASTGFVLARLNQSSCHGEGDSQAELRLFQVPILNFEALWLSYEGEGQDMLIPLHIVGRLAQYKLVPLSEALDALREALVHC